MKTYEEALLLITESISQNKKVALPVEKSVNYILAADIISDIDVAPYRNSAMDGFAVAYDDIESIPTTLPVKAISYAGDKSSYKYEKSTALKIMTGAPVPEGFDTVIKIEDTSFSESEVTISSEVKKHQNIRLPGEDIKKGDLLFKAGEKIQPLFIGILASIGLKEVSVIKKPNILILSTGNELVEPGKPLDYGQLYNSNSYTIRSMLSNLCENITADSILLDEKEKVISALNQQYDIIITSGGVSAGDKDYIPQIAEMCGWEKILHKTSIKPGKPIFFAKRDNQYLFGLPGNPLSTAVTCAVFVIPAIKKMIGRKNFMLNKKTAQLNPDSIMKSGRTVIWPGNFNENKNNITATFSDKKSSSALSALINSDGLIFQYSEENEKSKIEVSYWDDILAV
jgi:molybdopterin molybdotransferase